MFWGFPDLDPLVRGTDPDPSIIFEKLCKCTVPLKSNKQKNCDKLKIFVPVLKVTDKNSRIRSR
jgi:hypothetical protein